VTNTDRILRALRTSGVPLDDDELARTCGIRPRQQVNQICRRLEAQGLVQRIVGGDGKIVNVLRDAFEGRCLCGCGEPTDRNYRPGHDARHASQVGRDIAEMGHPESEEVERLLRSLPSDALRAKASRIANSRRVGTAATRATSVTSPSDGAMESGLPTAAGSSHEQRRAEAAMLRVLGARLGVTLAPRRLGHPSGAAVQIDGTSPDLDVLVECWAHQGKAKVAQKYKLVNDATKLAWIAKALDRPPARLILCVSDELAVAHLRGRSWQGAAIRELGVELEVVDLPADLVGVLWAAQKRQYR